MRSAHTTPTQKDGLVASLPRFRYEDEEDDERSARSGRLHMEHVVLLSMFVAFKD
jgi:hypothetical protein